MPTTRLDRHRGTDSRCESQPSGTPPDVRDGKVSRRPTKDNPHRLLGLHRLHLDGHRRRNRGCTETAIAVAIDMLGKDRAMTRSTGRFFRLHGFTASQRYPVCAWVSASNPKHSNRRMTSYAAAPSSVH